MTRAYDAIRSIVEGRAMPEPEPEPTCNKCEGGGWEMYGIGRGDPHFRVCEACDNPEGYPSP